MATQVALGRPVGGDDAELTDAILDPRRTGRDSSRRLDDSTDIIAI
ncbi:hypothetical protein WME99_28710 [Sorangium sp. So ce136]